MTLVIGALALNGMVFCSDTEEGTPGGGKRNVRKLTEYHGNDWDMIIGAAGFGPLCDVVAAKIRPVTEEPTFLAQVESSLSKVLKQIYDQYIPDTLPERKQYERQIQLVIGVINRNSNERRMYQSTEEIIHPVQHPYACAGIGQEIAYYLLDRLFDTNLEYDEASKLLAFVMREGKESVGSVGGNTQMLAIPYGQTAVIRTGYAPGWDAKEPRLWEVVNKFWIKQ